MVEFYKAYLEYLNTYLEYLSASAQYEKAITIIDKCNEIIRKLAEFEENSKEPENGYNGWTFVPSAWDFFSARAKNYEIWEEDVGQYKITIT